MDFRTFCDNDGCRKENRPVVDKETFVAYCTECAKPINSISIFMRRQLVSNGQVKKNDKKRLAWSVPCPSCKKEGPPELTKDGKDLQCSFCYAPLDNLARPFAQMIRVNLQAQRRANGE